MSVGNYLEWRSTLWKVNIFDNMGRITFVVAIKHSPEIYNFVAEKESPCCRIEEAC